MTLVRALIALGGLALAGIVIWAAFALHDLHGGFLDQARAIVTLPWGVATLADLLLGFTLFATLVFLTERSWVVAALWAAPVLVFGNIWAALWFVIRLPHLSKQLTKPDWPAS
jgi:hypothetical protein